MKNVLVLGGGKVGKSVAELLLACGRGSYRVTLADRDEANLREAELNLSRLKSLVPHKTEFIARKIDASDKQAVRDALKGMDYVVCMLPYNFVAGVAEIANEMGVNYFDVTEDVETTDQVKAIDVGGRAKVAVRSPFSILPDVRAITTKTQHLIL